MDVDTGRRELDWDLIHKEREEMKLKPAWRRAVNHMF